MTSERPATLTGRVALVTGAASGIGRAVTERFLSAGASVVAFDVDEGGLSTLQGERLCTVVGDVRHRETLDEAVAIAQERFGGLHILAAVAGVSSSAPFVEMTEADRDRILSINFLGVWNSIAASLPPLLEHGPGSRVLVCGSIESVLGGAGLAAYVASKHAVVGLVKSVALEVASQGVTVNVVSPAGVDTDLMRRILPPSGVQHVADTTPIPRLSQPDEIAAFFEFLAGPDASYMTGANVIVDGGLHLVNAHTSGVELAGEASAP